ncbi:unnamed protein product [Phaedon cochleariae]|uniref:CCD97-like C-terminal domain-containing protein n=1 Tax=Phaedon cochleariae TaxID=80249 RepID=A0A9P0GN62_PHACE|nr:unnamed protein product [Phaedon cochleariae]
MTQSMELEANSEDDENPQESDSDTKRDDIINFLTYNNDICFKPQQRWDPDLTKKEKFEIALKLFKDNKLNFLVKFGKYLKEDQLDYFYRFTQICQPDFQEIKVVLTELQKEFKSGHQSTQVKNRRYEALKHMVEENSYFSEIEMMKRNPLLYEQLVGQYLTTEEVKERDKYKSGEEATLVKILMEGIERDNAEKARKEQEEKEDGQMEEEEDNDSDGNTNSSSDEEEATNIPTTSRWGEFEQDKAYRPKPKRKNPFMTPQERIMLKEEFITTMYQNFLDGKDEDFDYDTVDTNTSYDNIDEMDQDAEEKYFDADDVEENGGELGGTESSEDELDIYMNALRQNPVVTELSHDLKKL